jgi:hypothetical protein
VTSGPSDLHYEVSLHGEIDFIAPFVWTQFALANEAPELADLTAIRGHPLERFVAGADPELHRAITGRWCPAPLIPYTFRCDCPASAGDADDDPAGRREASSGFAFRSSFALRECEPGAS